MAASKCGDNVMRVARALHISDLSACAVNTYVRASNDNSSQQQQQQRMQIVTLYFGPVEDCPSGCIQKYRSAIVRGDSSTITPISPLLAHRPSPYTVFFSWRLRALLLEQGVEDALAHDFFGDPARGLCMNYIDHVHLETEGDEVRWVIAVPEGTRCVAHKRLQPTEFRFDIAGEVRIPIAGPNAKRPTGGSGFNPSAADDSRLTINVVTATP